MEWQLSAAMVTYDVRRGTDIINVGMSRCNAVRQGHVDLYLGDVDTSARRPVVVGSDSHPRRASPRTNTAV